MSCLIFYLPTLLNSDAGDFFLLILLGVFPGSHNCLKNRLGTECKGTGASANQTETLYSFQSSTVRVLSLNPTSITTVLSTLNFWFDTHCNSAILVSYSVAFQSAFLCRIFCSICKRLEIFMRLNVIYGKVKHKTPQVSGSPRCPGDQIPWGSACC